MFDGRGKTMTGKESTKLLLEDAGFHPPWEGGCAEGDELWEGISKQTRHEMARLRSKMQVQGSRS